MATVRCPKCGTINPNGRRRLARCRRCREALGKCRYCEHYDPRMQDCTHPARESGVRVLDADEVLNCPEFSSTLVAGAPGRRRLLRVLRTALVAIVGTLLLMLGAIRVYHRVTELPPPVLLRASVSAPAVSFQDDGFDVTVLVRNQAEHAARQVEVIISGRSMRHLTCDRVEPAEAFLGGSGQSVRALVGDLQPREIGSLLFHFTAQETGEMDLAAHVIAANVEGSVRVPIEGEVVP